MPSEDKDMLMLGVRITAPFEEILLQAIQMEKQTPKCITDNFLNGSLAPER